MYYFFNCSDRNFGINTGFKEKKVKSSLNPSVNQKEKIRAANMNS